MDISVVIVSYNTRDLLAETLQSITQTMGSLDHEIIVVDNASVDGSPAMVATRFPSARLIPNTRNRGFAAANNQAIEVSNARYVLLLNSDAVLMPEAAGLMLRFMKTNPDVAIVGGQLLNADGSFQGSYADFPRLVGEVLLATKLAGIVYGPNYPSYGAERSQVTQLVDWVSGAFMMVRKAAIDGVGAMDEEYFMYSEETDWCYRMKRAGWQIAYLPDAQVRHLIGRSSHHAPERRRGQIYRSKWLFFRKHHGVATASAYYAVIKMVSCAKLVGWALLGLLPDRAESARSHVRSYVWLLNQL